MNQLRESELADVIGGADINLPVYTPGPSSDYVAGLLALLTTSRMPQHHSD